MANGNDDDDTNNIYESKYVDGKRSKKRRGQLSLLSLIESDGGG